VNRVLGVDVSTTRLAFATITGQRLERAWSVQLPADHVNRLAAAYDCAAILPNGLVVVPEDPPMVRNSAVHRALCEVLGAFLAGCTHAAWVHPGIPVSSWKLASVGKGNATKTDVANWVGETYGAYLLAPESGNQDIWDAIGIAHAGAAWWATRGEAA
jgi:hypothetical protein